MVNAAGLGSDEVDRMFGGDGFTIRPRRGELIVFDKLARTLMRSILLPVPTARTKGVLVAPTVYGNVLLGPTAEDVPDRCDTATTAAGLGSLIAAGRRILPGLAEEEVTATYAGLRAATEHADYQIRVDAARRYACAAGIRSTGPSASLGIAEHVVGLLGEAGLRAAAAALAGRCRVMPYIGEAGRRPYQDAERIAADAAYGQIVCHCERVTRGEIRDALASPVPPADLGGLRRRTRAMNGRCQGFYCAAAVSRLFWSRGRAVTSTSLVVGAGRRAVGGRRTAAARRRSGARGRPGGRGRRVPRHSWHTGYGLRDLHRVMTGPAYARALAAAAVAAGAELRLGTTVTCCATRRDGRFGVTLTSAAGHRDGARGGRAARHRLPGAAAGGAAGPRRPPGRGDDHRRAAAAGVPGARAAGPAGPWSSGRSTLASPRR